MFIFRGLFLRAAVIIVVLVVAAGAGWWFFIREDAQLATSAPVIPEELRNDETPAATGNGGSSQPASGSRRYVVVPEQSEAAYFAEEKLAALPLPSRAKGSTRAVEGEFYLTSEGLDSSVDSTFTVDLRTLKSDDSRRDNRVQTQGLETSKYPTATFTATRLDGWPAEFPAGEDVDLALTGVLSLHGVERDVTWDVKARMDQPAFTALATLTFKYADFGISHLNIANFVTVTDEVTLQVSIIAGAD